MARYLYKEDVLSRGERSRKLVKHLQYTRKGEKSKAYLILRKEKAYRGSFPARQITKTRLGGGKNPRDRATKVKTEGRKKKLTRRKKGTQTSTSRFI